MSHPKVNIGYLIPAALEDPPVGTAINGLIDRFGGVTGAALPLRNYTVATLPDATKYQWGLIAVSDGTANKRLAISDGVAWRWPDGNVVS